MDNACVIYTERLVKTLIHFYLFTLTSEILATKKLLHKKKITIQSRTIQSLWLFFYKFL
jgi:hypothetical protein